MRLRRIAFLVACLAGAVSAGPLAAPAALPAQEPIAFAAAAPPAAGQPFATLSAVQAQETGRWGRVMAAADRGMGAEDQPLFVRAGIDTIVPQTDELGNVTTVTLPRYAQYSGKCGAFGSSATPFAQDVRNNYGVECQGIRRAMDWESSIQLQGKLQYTYGTGSSVSLTGLASGARSGPSSLPAHGK